MKKAEAEAGVRRLVHEWRGLPANRATETRKLNNSDFESWLRDEHPQYLIFKCVGGVSDQIERWFAQELSVPSYLRNV
ncbi:MULTISPECIES: hypothetical protein [Xanthomonas]|uniref:Uncharacterized protein n=1 Tax=Xanthomonas perforans TaxID=442694 RepID=A0A6L9VQU1_XANPE|nr:MULTISPECIES: hypothetical protein [Xanthomonas]MBV6853740.1 hypothetical protein [Xanthomonas campestris pv. mirabilis]MBZ2603447.1 hypothetical protein [Xanthomonas perforans]MBZ2745907.1 hypothetical protein [Xanthomonas perforans]MBZ3073880.1 hypothetical protein [Xanthomonas perforans]MBZ3143740.1 hypothetical protein [Xanthomonas perforans]